MMFDPEVRKKSARWSRFATRLTGLVLAALLGCGPATAETWKDYTYPSYGFAIQFPDKPKVEDSTYKTSNGGAYPARSYHLERDNIEYKMTVVDFSRESWSEPEVIGRAIATLAQVGEIKLNIPHRIRRVYGRQLSIANWDGGHSSIAVFYYRKRLYQIQGTVLASNPDLASADATRFQQSLQFTNSSDARTPGFDPFFDLPPANRPGSTFSR